jgi:hypothetical protein
VNARPRLSVVTVADIPRADEQIRRTIERLRATQFAQDHLFDAAVSFRQSIQASAQKREGLVIEAAIKDAIAQAEHLKLIPNDKRLPRRVDVQFEVRNTGWLVALEIKRGSLHDSGAIRQFRSDLLNIPPLLRTALPLFPIENVHYHIVFINGEPPFAEGLKPIDLSRLYDLHIVSHILTARQQYSAAITQVLKERGL